MQISIGNAVLIVNTLSVADGQAQIGTPNGGQITYAFQINVAVVQGAVYDTQITYEIKTGTMEYVEIPAERIDDVMGLTASSATTNYTGKGKQNPAQAIGQISVYLSFLDNDVIEQIVKDILSRNSKRKYTIKASYKNTDYAYDYYLGGSSAKIIKSKGKIIGIEATFVEAF